jgi:acetyl esterase
MERAPRLAAYAAPDVNALLRVRRRVGAKLVSRAFIRAAKIGRLARNAKPEAHGLTLINDVAYLRSGLPEHTLDVYKPADAPPVSAKGEGLPVVFYVHGGAFRSLSKDTHWIMGLAFGRRGMVVAMPNYRLAPEHRFPAALEDLTEALRYVKAHAREWGGDPDKIIFAGESAGANLVTSLALAIAYEREEPWARLLRSIDVNPLAVLAACGVFEVTNGKRFASKYGVNWFFDDRYQELEMDYPPWKDGKPLAHDLVNPVQLLEREAPKRPLPPFFLPVGGLDHLKDDHERMEAALLKHGADVVNKVYPGEIHAFHAFIFRENARQCWRDHYEFLRARGVAVKDDVTDVKIR